MTDTGPFLLFLHLLGGATWLGASMFANVVLVPFVARRPANERPELVWRLILGPERLIIGSALLAGVTGLLLGMTSGRLGGIDAVATAYGALWVASIVAAIAVFATGGLITSRAAAQLAGKETADGAGTSASDDDAAIRRLRIGFAVELAGIVTILGLMVALGRS